MQIFNGTTITFSRRTLFRIQIVLIKWVNHAFVRIKYRKVYELIVFLLLNKLLNRENLITERIYSECDQR